MVVATAPAYDPELDKLVAAEVTSALVGRVVGKRAASAVVRRVPLAGGVWAAGTDAYAPGRSGSTPSASCGPDQRDPALDRATSDATRVTSR